MARTLKIFSVLLSYPSPEIQAVARDMRTVLEEESLLRGRDLAAVLELVDELATRDIYDLQERYTLLFDRSRSLSLHLFEHVHGESRDRGQAMVDLARHYEARGFTPAESELPDYLPMFLEFLSFLPIGEARALLGDALHVVEALEMRLRKRSGPYAGVLRGVRAVARSKADPVRLRELRVDVGAEPDDLEALDAEWEEAAVTFGPGDAEGACGRTRLMTRLRAHARACDNPGTA